MVTSSQELSLLAQTSVIEALPPAAVQEILNNPPFIPIPHALNLRVLSSPNLAPNLIFRSGAISQLPPSSLSVLATHNITTVFDLRSRNEREKNPSPAVEGIETIWIPSTIDVESGDKPRLLLQDVKAANFAANDGVNGYISMYTNVLHTHLNAYRAFFRHLLLPQSGGVLFHCTAGRDRTGVLAALIHGLVDSPPEIIALDYEITRIGVEPFREQLLLALFQQMGIAGEMKLEDMKDEPGLEELCNTRGPTIVAFLRSLDEKYGEAGRDCMYPGVKGYVTKDLGISEEEWRTIREKLAPTTLLRNSGS